MCEWDSDGVGIQCVSETWMVSVSCTVSGTRLVLLSSTVSGTRMVSVFSTVSGTRMVSVSTTVSGTRLNVYSKTKYLQVIIMVLHIFEKLPWSITKKKKTIRRITLKLLQRHSTARITLHTKRNRNLNGRV